MQYNRKVPFPALFFVVFSFAIFYLFLFYCCCSSSAVTIGCGNKTVTEGDAPFSLGASASNGAALSYQSSDPSIASVDGAGNVTIYRAGSVQIIACSSLRLDSDCCSSDTCYRHITVLIHSHYTIIIT